MSLHDNLIQLGDTVAVYLATFYFKGSFRYQNDTLVASLARAVKQISYS